MERTCPNCYTKWAHKCAKKATVKLLFNRKAREIVHAIISFRGEPNEIWKQMDNVYNIAKQHNIDGGIVIPHFERHGAVDGYLHYHIVGYVSGRYVPGNSRLAYIFKVIRYIHKNYDHRGVIKYLLTHCAISRGKKALNYFGQRFRKPITNKQYHSGHACFFCGSKNTVPVEKTDWTNPIKPDVCYCFPKPSLNPG